MGSVGGKRGLWGFVRGGMGAVSNAIADSARSAGAEIRTNATVESDPVGKDAPPGVVLAGWRRDRRAGCRQQSYAALDVPELIECEAAARRTSLPSMRKYRSEGTSCKINLALNGLPSFRASSRHAWPAASRHDAHLPVH